DYVRGKNEGRGASEVSQAAAAVIEAAVTQTGARGKDKTDLDNARERAEALKLIDWAAILPAGWITTGEDGKKRLTSVGRLWFNQVLPVLINASPDVLNSMINHGTGLV